MLHLLRGYKICEAGEKCMNVLPIGRRYQFIGDSRRKTIIPLRGSLGDNQENQTCLNEGEARNRRCSNVVRYQTFQESDKVKLRFQTMTRLRILLFSFYGAFSMSFWKKQIFLKRLYRAQSLVFNFSFNKKFKCYSLRKNLGFLWSRTQNKGAQ